MKLTDHAVRTAKLTTAGKPREIWDSSLEGFLVRLSPLKSGKLSRTFKIIVKTSDNKRVPKTIGKFPGIDTETARQRALELLAGKVDTAGMDTKQAHAARQLKANGAPRNGEAVLAADMTLHAFTAHKYAKLAVDMKSVDRAVKEVARLFPNVPVAGITKGDVLEWRGKLVANGLSPRSVNRYMGVLSSVMQAAITLGVRTDNPASQGRLDGVKLKESREKSRFFTREEWALFDAELGRGKSPQWFVDLCRVAAGSGCRKGELLKLVAADVDIEAGQVQLRAGTTKAGETRTVFPTKAAMAILTRRIEEKGGKGRLWAEIPEDDTMTQLRFDNALRRSGVAKHDDLGRSLSFRSIRTTVGSWIAQETRDIYTVSKVLGNTIAVAEAHYGHLTGDNVRDAMKVLEL